MGTALALKVVAICCFAITLWIVFAGLHLAGAFLVEEGPFSHWQVWMACGAFAQLAAFRLKRKRQLLS